MQVCTSLQTDNHASTPPLCFLQAGCPSCRPTNSVKALKAHNCKLLVPHLNSNPLECILFSQYHYINPISTHTHTHTHPFNGPLSRTTWVSRYQKGKTDLDFTEARGSEWHWHQLGHMQDCVSLQTDNRASTPHSFFTGRMPFLPPSQQCQSTEGQYPLSSNIPCDLYHLCY